MQLLSTHTHSGGDMRDRTADLKLAKLPLSQLSYIPKFLESQLGLLPHSFICLPRDLWQRVYSLQAEFRTSTGN
jgi:hypothetical protein